MSAVGIDNNYHFFNELFPAAPIVGGVLVFIIAAVVAVLVIAVMIYWLKRCIKYILKCGLIIPVHGYTHAGIANVGNHQSMFTLIQ